MELYDTKKDKIKWPNNWQQNIGHAEHASSKPQNQLSGGHQTALQPP